MAGNYSPAESALLEVVQQHPHGIAQEMAINKTRAKTGLSIHGLVLAAANLLSRKAIFKNEEGWFETDRVRKSSGQYARKEITPIPDERQSAPHRPARAPRTVSSTSHKKERAISRQQQAVWAACATPKSSRELADELGIRRTSIHAFVRHLRMNDRLQQLGYDMDRGGFLYLQAGLQPPAEPEPAVAEEPNADQTCSQDDAGVTPALHQHEIEHPECEGVVTHPHPEERPTKESRVVVQDGTLAYQYLQAVLARGGHGESISQVMERLVWQGIQRLVADRWIDRIEDFEQ